MSNVNPHKLTTADQELESALRSLTPARPASLDPLLMAYEAGTRATARHVRFWRATTCLSAAAAALAIVLIPSRRIDLQQTRVESSSGYALVEPQQRVSDQSVLRLRDVALRDGLDALPTLPTTASEPIRLRQSL